MDKFPLILENVPKNPETTNEVTIQNLPDEMLEKILLFLELEDLKSALQVCRRWSTLKFIWPSVQLVVHYERDGFNEAECRQTLLASNRRYKHLLFIFSFNRKQHILMKDILIHFSWSLESLKLSFRFVVPIKLELFAVIAAHCVNLKSLHLENCLFNHGRWFLEFAPMNNLKEAYLESNLPNVVTNMQKIMPNISKLHIQIKSSPEAVNFLKHVSSQLLELKITFLSDDHFLAVCSMHFPLLRKIYYSCDDLEIGDRVTSDRMVPDYRFFQRLPELKELIFRGYKLDGDVSRWYQSISNIEVLCLRVDLFSEDTFRAICQLKHLKRLRIEESLISTSLELNLAPLKSLQMLSLYFTRIEDQLKFNQFVLHTFPSVSIMELLYLSPSFIPEDPFQLYANICSNMSSLQRLVLAEQMRLDLGQLINFCASRRLRELRLTYDTPVDTVPLNESCFIHIQTLALNTPGISEIQLEKLLQTMRELKRLEMIWSRTTLEEIRRLRAMFPWCEIKVRQEVQIEEPL